jgi:hypothetical protein
MDFPSSLACWTPIGLNTPWLIALFKNNIFRFYNKCWGVISNIYLLDFYKKIKHLSKIPAKI